MCCSLVKACDSNHGGGLFDANDFQGVINAHLGAFVSYWGTFVPVKTL